MDDTRSDSSSISASCLTREEDVSEDTSPWSQHDVYSSISLDDVKAHVVDLSSQVAFEDDDHLWRESKRVATRLLALHTMINRRAPISRLPDELFLEILHHPCVPRPRLICGSPSRMFVDSGETSPCIAQLYGLPLT